MASNSGTKRLARNTRSGPPAKRSTPQLTKEDSSSDSESTSDSELKHSYFFHYTNKKGRDAIAKHGVIKASDDVSVDASFGEGVYLTSLPPLDGKLAVARNNWEQAFDHALKNRKLDYVILISMPVDDVVRAETKRDVYLYEGHLVLEEYDHEILTWKKAVKRCTELVSQMLEDQEDEESYDDDVDVWMPYIFPY